MGYGVRFDDGTEATEDAVFAFGSATDIMDMRQWVKGLPRRHELYPHLEELAKTLRTTGTMDLSIELEGALENEPPPEHLEPILRNFLENIGTGDDDETCIIGGDE